MHDIKCKAVILCDEIRQEKSDKYLLIGVYPGSVTTQQMPGQMGLSVYFALQSEAVGEFDLNIEVDCGANKNRLTMHVTVTDTSESFAIPTPRFLLVAEEPGDIVVRLSTGEEEAQEVARFPVKSNSKVWSLFPTEPPQPSEQSETDAQE